MANTQEYGLFQLMDEGILHPNATATTVDSGLLISAINYDIAQHNADVDVLLRLFCENTTAMQAEVNTDSSSRSQPVDEYGRAKPIKRDVPYTVGFPIQGSGNAIGQTYLWKNMATVGDMGKALTRMFRGDMLWVRDHIFGVFFDNVGYSFSDPTGLGTLAVKGLANSDTVTYYSQYTDALATDTHYAQSASAISDTNNPFPTVIKDELLEHPTNGGDVISFVPSNLVATVEALTEFHSAMLDPDIELGTNATRLVGSLGSVIPPKARLRGKTESGVWIVEWPSLPSNYFVSICTEGPRPIMRRQFPQAALQGFKPVGTLNEFPYFQDQWQRWEGYGAFNRVGAQVYRSGNGSYAVPTGYTVPMP
jgi:hypothetical protein